MLLTCITVLGPRAVGFSTDYTPVTTSGGLWRQKAQDVTFSAIGNVTYTLGGGEDYSAGIPEIGANGGMTATLGNLVSGYGLFQNKDEIQVDYLIMGPGLTDKTLSQAKANYLISLANSRKDCMDYALDHTEMIWSMRPIPMYKLTI